MYLPEKVAHRACLSVKLDRSPHRPIVAHFVVHLPLCLYVLFRVVGPLHIIGGGGGGGGEGTVAFLLANLRRRLHIDFLWCICRLDNVVLLVHCCVLQVSCIQGTPLCPVSCRTLQFFVISAMD